MNGAVREALGRWKLMGAGAAVVAAVGSLTMALGVAEVA